MKYRFESFGGILALENPPMLVHVDRDFMRSLGHDQSKLWERPEAGLLSAPLEVHFSVTNACSLRCGHCYMDSGERDAGEMSAEAFRQAVDLLAGMGVFHMALGGGEALERSDFFELASYVRDRGIVPNLTTNGLLMTRETAARSFRPSNHQCYTTNGLLMTRETAARCRIFGQVNVSLDATDILKGAKGGPDAPANGVQAVDLLLEADIKVGVNFVVTRQNFDQLDAVLSFAGVRGLTDVEFLRLKPKGRGKLDYYEMRLTPAQNREFYPTIRSLSQKYDVPAKIDCSFVPMFCWHSPDKTLMEQFSVYGCEAGNVLLGVRSDGRFAGCSFLSGEESIFELPSLWSSSEHLSRLRKWTDRAPEPCRSCDYLEICKGGCRAVAGFVASDFYAADPECPFVDGEG